ncbi:MAG: glycoside hydrolase family 32 protein [Ferruginibacter sp.]|nr:glycoside hydrolase family 32 protein [Cytophagales bacterium]
MKTSIVGLIPCLLILNLSAPAQEHTRQIKVKKGQTYLNFPVSNASGLTKARIKYAGKVLDEFTIQLASGKPDFWTFFNVAPYQGKTITVEVEPDTTDPKGLAMVYADTGFPGQDSLYAETYRPQVHFSSRRGWNNDPNGLIHYRGEYHLFYQHNPYGWSWGNMHWGHAVSEDLMHWRELPEALYPPSHQDMAFSGSAVVDVNNTAGFRKNGVDPLIAVYTSTGRGECLALSYDNGRTFQNYEGNPVVKHQGRDPKVFWYAPGSHWVMVLWDEGDTKNLNLGQQAIVYQHLIYTSPDLKRWTRQSGIAGFFECPELFELPVEGAPGVSKWVMYDATGRYLVGDFDGKKFSVAQSFKTYDYGGAFYASQTYNHLPENDKRRVQVGWGRGINLAGMAFNQCMTFPTELRLRKTADGLRLCPTPVREISLLHKKTHTFENKVIAGKTTFTPPVSGDALHLVAEFEKGDAPEFGLHINGYALTYSHLLGKFNQTDYVNPDSDHFKIEVIVDKAILEVFVNDGELYYVVPLNSVKAEKKIEVFAKGGPERKTILRKMDIHELGSIWSKQF